jgi:mannose-6-phosphate isomerase-like protein (cupin superfamily)
MVFKATGATTGGRFSLMDRHLPPGGRMPPAHRHVQCVEAFFVLEGDVTFVLDGRRP